jgi:hypothetical protein
LCCPSIRDAIHSDVLPGQVHLDTALFCMRVVLLVTRSVNEDCKSRPCLHFGLLGRDRKRHSLSRVEHLHHRDQQTHQNKHPFTSISNVGMAILEIGPQAHFSRIARRDEVDSSSNWKRRWVSNRTIRLSRANKMKRQLKFVWRPGFWPLNFDRDLLYCTPEVSKVTRSVSEGGKPRPRPRFG